ncbi:ATP-binding cassette sub-family G member 5-like isoform X1 [Tigriopus californicus]|uniref:ATP-binding cassette sub-family G member 5-like isoform X1 n=2 Tax=Tigriopus californicus TaxID=6832 RepID=UPI0027DA704A|nr:ATP-binding cassette sub-family G member 5-like isoform X1 [Tigriopus californicus]
MTSAEDQTLGAKHLGFVVRAMQKVANVFHSGQVEKGTQIQKLIGAIRTGVILKDVSMSSFGGELSAVLGSKGSGKRAFLDVISRRAQGPTRGQIMLNGVPMSMRLFQDSCGFVGKSQDLLHGLTVRQTLSFTIELSLGSKISADSKSSRVKQILADFALTDLRNRLVEDLNKSEYRRLAIAKNLVRDPVLLLLDEPTNDLNPLDAYFVISILANHAKQNNRIIILTIEKPRSDIFPFLDRATYLCLGDVVYTGPTRMMLEYFRSIGFPCPELENPLMYYLCLSTVDRRSRERFVESNNQIASLVEKFKIEGVHYQHLSNTTTTDIKTKIPLTAFGRPSTVVKIWILLRRSLSGFFHGGAKGIIRALFHLLFLNILFFFIWAIYFSSMTRPVQFQTIFSTKRGLILNICVATHLAATITAVLQVAPARTAYYSEYRQGLYNGPSFVVSQTLRSFPLSVLVTFTGSLLLYKGLGHEDCFSPKCTALLGYHHFLPFWLTIWACFMFSEQQVLGLLLAIKSRVATAIIAVFLSTTALVVWSGTTRSLLGLPNILTYMSYGSHARYVGITLNSIEFFDQENLNNLGWQDDEGRIFPCNGNTFGFGCRYINGTHYLQETYGLLTVNLDELMNVWHNALISVSFFVGMFALNLVLYVLPIPLFIKLKFREEITEA